MFHFYVLISYGIKSLILQYHNSAPNGIPCGFSHLKRQEHASKTQANLDFRLHSSETFLPFSLRRGYDVVVTETMIWPYVV